MSRAVCGVCFCPYGDEGDCACSTETHYKKVIDNVQALFDAMREQPAPVASPHEQQELVAHQYQDREGVWRDFMNEKHYKDTVADGTWPIRSLCVCALPLASKPWVGLTDEEFQWIYDNGRTPVGMMELVEAKLKEKNT